MMENQNKHRINWQQFFWKQYVEPWNYFKDSDLRNQKDRILQAFFQNSIPQKNLIKELDE